MARSVLPSPDQLAQYGAASARRNEVGIGRRLVARNVYVVDSTSPELSAEPNDHGQKLDHGEDESRRF